MSVLPQNTPISQWEFKEIISPNLLMSGAIFDLAVPVWLPERRIYLYLEANLSSALPFQLYARINTFLSGNPLGSFPAYIADFTGQALNQSVGSLFNAGGSPVGDSLVLRLANPFDTTVPSVVVQPLRINAGIDRIQLKIDNVSGASLTGFRAYLGVLSTLY